MSSNLNVNISMSADTVEELQKSGYSLFAFRAVETSREDGMPVVWFSTGNYAENTQVNWMETYEAYASNSKVEEGVQVTASCHRLIDLGQKMDVTKPIQCQNPVAGIKEVISVANTTDAKIPSVGISEKDNLGKFAPLCAFSLLGLNLIMIKPITKVFLMFGTNTMVTKTVIAKSIGPGIIIDLTEKQERYVSYDANKGWKWNPKEGYAKDYEAGSDLVPQLIIPSQDLKRAAVKAGSDLAPQLVIPSQT